MGIAVTAVRVNTVATDTAMISTGSEPGSVPACSRSIIIRTRGTDRIGVTTSTPRLMRNLVNTQR